MKFKVLALAALTGMLFSTSTLAADAPIEVDAVAYDWSGFYVGGQIGYGFGDIQSDLLNAAVGTPIEIDVDGLFAGAHAGYDYQVGNFVIGAFADIDYLDMDVDLSIPAIPFSGPVADVEGYLARAELKLGYAMDRTLFYAHGGVAYVDASIKSAALALIGTNSVDFDETGYVVGAGVSQAFTQNLVGSMEYAYHRFDDLELKTSLGNLQTDANLDVHLFKAKLSYRF